MQYSKRAGRPDTETPRVRREGAVWTSVAEPCPTLYHMGRHRGYDPGTLLFMWLLLASPLVECGPAACSNSQRGCDLRVGGGEILLETVLSPGESAKIGKIHHSLPRLAYRTRNKAIRSPK